MLKSEGLKFLLQKLRNSDSNVQNTILKDIKSQINLLETQDIQLLLGFLNTINDIELELKLFSLLSMCLALDDRHYSTIVTYNQIYEKIEVILSKGLPMKTTTILNFITVLVFTEDVDYSFSIRKNLASNARNMIRVSGCLSVMTTLFVNSMMFPDTWKALCQCLAECCRDCQPNKLQCAYLIPLCVQKCLQGFSDVLTVLQAVLCDCSKNIQTFLQSNGTRIFTKELLQYTSCLQVLSTVVQSSKHAAATIRTTDTPRHVTEILHWNGPHSQKGQWCTIVLYYLNPCDKSKNRVFMSTIPRDPTVNIHDETNNEKPDKSDKETTLTHSGGKRINDGIDKANEATDDTTNLFRNVVQEILYWKSKDEANVRIKPFINACIAPQTEETIKNSTLTHEFSTLATNKNILSSSTAKFSEYVLNKNNNHNEVSKVHTKTDNELSFSFLKEDEHLSYNVRPQKNRQISYVKEYQIQEQKIKPKGLFEKCVQTNFETTSTFSTQFNSHNISRVTLKNFQPTVTSTPKRKPPQKFRIANSLIENRYDRSKKALSIFLSKQREKNNRKKIKKAKNSPVAKLTSRSMSARFMTAINESCTTLVKTVKDVFMPWKNSTTASKESNKADKNIRTTSNSTSFMSFMRKRDAILGNESVVDGNHYCKSIENNFSFELNDESPCKTCNDTTILKQKLEDNEYLSKTVKKLKLGVNLYGCNFKKISKTFWPKESYMTPAVLYGLYRKLILK